MSVVGQIFRRFMRRSDGNATIEFAILFPGIMTLFLMGFEAGFLMVRNVSLERAVDITVRDVRLGNLSADGEIPGHDAIKRSICDNVIAVSDCLDTVKVEMVSVPNTPGSVQGALSGRIECIDRSAPEEDQAEVGTFDVGLENEMMVMHVCATTNPLFPTSRLGVGLIVDGQGNEAILATTAFVNEPGARFIPGTEDDVDSGGTDGGGFGAGGNDDDDDDKKDVD